MLFNCDKLLVANPIRSVMSEVYGHSKIKAKRIIKMKRVFGVVEVVFDAVYLTTAFIIGITLIFTGTGNTARLTAGVMALVLAGGDAFHLVPRMKVIVSKNEEPLRKALGRGKQITSITMTVFYLFL